MWNSFLRACSFSVHVKVISNIPGLGVVGSAGRGAGRKGGVRVPPGLGGEMRGGL